ncbi:MAG: glutamine synthetase [Clostridioides sp.]|jgi:glutamine synthetase|nr:glutamine synthetase [Clostridioides sp.]
MKDLLYVIEKNKYNTGEIKNLLNQNPSIRFVSLMGVDLGGNATDVKIPMGVFIEDIDKFLASTMQTDGSSVELYEIATLNNAKVDLMPDSDANWYVDYNVDNIDDETGNPVGTLIIPAYLIHDEKKVCSRGILQKAEKNFKHSLMTIFREYPDMIRNIGIDDVDDIADIEMTTATELEFWVNTPEDKANLEKLHVSQSLKEQYWKRTRGIIRTCLEKTLVVIERLGINPELAHKEVGGIPSSISIEGKTNHAMEQLEISWRFSDPIQACDNELIVRNVIEDVFSTNGLEVTFKAKPIERVAGSGGHTHLGVSAKLKNGENVNLFGPKVMTEDFLSKIGYGAIMGLLKNYDVVSPIVTSLSDEFNRLVPGFEAPICTVVSLGHSYGIPSRNRSVLVGYIRDMKNPRATRFELRAPSPLSNKYLVSAACYQTMLDGIEAVAKSGLDTKALEKELSKEPGEEGFYLETEKAYRDEHNIFEHYSQDELDARFSVLPRTVFENMKNFEPSQEKLAVLKKNDVFSDVIIKSFRIGALDKWQKQLNSRVINKDLKILREIEKKHNTDSMDALDEVNWNTISDLKFDMLKDTLTRESLFTRINNAVESKDYQTASDLQIELKDKISLIQELYMSYKKNIY